MITTTIADEKQSVRYDVIFFLSIAAALVEPNEIVTNDLLISFRINRPVAYTYSILLRSNTFFFGLGVPADWDVLSFYSEVFSV